MFEIEYSLDVSGLKNFVEQLESRFQEISNLKEAVQVGGNYIVQKWIKNAESKFKHSQGGYVLGITEGVSYPFQGDALQFQAVNKVPYAKAIEDGFNPFDMKKALETSKKVRVSKEGKRYLVIPFEHGTPGSSGKREMPKEIYKEAKELSHSAITGIRKEGIVQGAKGYAEAEMLKQHNPDKVNRNNYVWGDRLTSVDKSSPYYGMVRFQKNPTINREKLELGKFVGASKNATENYKSYSSYMTFRVMSEDSIGWNHPGMGAMNILRDTISQNRDAVNRMLADAAKKDMKLIFGDEI